MNFPVSQNRTRTNSRDKMASVVSCLRDTGIDLPGKLPWGTHFCQFYHTPDDLVDILVPYFVQGLADHELCLWVTSEPLTVNDAVAALRSRVKNLDESLQNGQIEILDYRQWYMPTGRFDVAKVLKGWEDKARQAIHRGFAGLRLSANTFWLEKNNWRDFLDYETAVDEVISRYPMLALCTYSLDRCSALEIIEVVSRHRFALIHQAGRWQKIESQEQRKIEHQLRETENNYQALFNGIGEGFALHQILPNSKDQTLNYRFLAVNPAFERFTGIKKETLLGKNVREVLDPRHALFQIYPDASSPREPRHFETYCPKCERYYELLTFYPAETQFAVLLMDITDRKLAHMALENAQALLEQRVQERTAKLVKANKELVRSNKDLEQFAYIASHDLQEPLRMVVSFVQLLERKYGDQLDEEGKKYIHFAVEGSLRMQGLIKNLLDCSQITLRGNSFKPVACENIIKAVQENLMQIIRKTHAQVTYDPLPVVPGDEEQLLQVFQNLIENAIKYRQADQTPQIHIRAEAQDKRWLFSIQDNGIGIECLYFNRIFEIFKRLHPRHKYPGNGIGLTLVKRIVNRHQGKIWITSTPGVGSTFYFTLPMSQDNPT